MAKKVSIFCTGSPKIFHELVCSVEDSIKELYPFNTYYWNPNKKLHQADINIVIHGKNIINYLTHGSFNILIATEQPQNAIIEKHGYHVVLDIVDGNKDYFPLGYSKFFDIEKHADTEDIDYVFFGQSTEKRRKDIAKRYGINYYSEVYGEKRDALISRAKFNVNILNYPEKMYSPLRGMLSFCKGKVLLQEKAKGFYGHHKPYIIEFTEHNFRDVVEKWKDDKKRKEFGMFIRESLMKQSFKENFLNRLKKHI